MVCCGVEKLNSPQRHGVRSTSQLPSPTRLKPHHHSHGKHTPQEASSQAKAYFSLKSLWWANSFTPYQQGE